MVCPEPRAIYCPVCNVMSQIQDIFFQLFFDNPDFLCTICTIEDLGGCAKHPIYDKYNYFPYFTTLGVIIS